MIAKFLARFRKPEALTTAPEVTPQEIALNDELDRLRKVTGGHPRAEHKVLYRGLFEGVMRAIRKRQPDATMEEVACQVLPILVAARGAASLRRNRLLPAGRANVDYRKYATVYTYALVTAVAVEGVIGACGGEETPRGKYSEDNTPRGKYSEDNTPESADRLIQGLMAWAVEVIPEQGLDWLFTQTIVQEDWISYFEDPESSLMVKIVRQAREWIAAGENPQELQKPKVSAQEIIADLRVREKLEPGRKDRGGTVTAPTKAGWEIIDAIKASLADGSLPSCQPGATVQVDRDGRTFLETPTIYHWYRENHDLTREVGTIQNRFTRLKLTDRVGRLDTFRGRFSANAEPQTGIVISKSSIFWGDETPPGTFVLEGMK